VSKERDRADVTHYSPLDRLSLFGRERKQRNDDSSTTLLRPVQFQKERHEVSNLYGSGAPDAEILRCAQDDSPDTAHIRSREVFSPNACGGSSLVDAGDIIWVKHP
jgi:hypothetical protein